ncbi:MAG TPA: aspartate aminotransferase family protein [Acidimicrobiia bacterium]|nr:aspartate aminotransferase family protein [Acidimicrobiia bacterium]
MSAGDTMARRAAEITATETERLLERTPKSRALYERAVSHMPYGVGSSFQANDPYPIYVEQGMGSHLWDVDENEYVDFHGGFGCNVVGHAHPKIVEAVDRAVRTGTHFATTTEVTVAFAEELCRRFGLEKVRFTNSGTEATMDAIRIARAATGRDDVVKMEGSYHGHHDTVMFSVLPNADAMGGREQPSTTPMSKGIPADVALHTHVVAFNDAEALARMLDDRSGSVACVILEPVMMNIGVVLPEAGYLEAVRELCTRHGVVLIFDEVKSGATIAAGGAIERFGVQPDLACFAKAIGGGTPTAAFGGRADVMEVIEHGAAQQGTFNGNPLVAAAGLAALTQVLTADAYEYLGHLGTRLADGCSKAIAEHGIPAHTVDLGAKGCVSYRSEPLRNYRDFLETRTELYNASYPWAVNRGVFMTPGDEEQWTLSVQHTEGDIDRYVDAFADFCAAVARG